MWAAAGEAAGRQWEDAEGGESDADVRGAMAPPASVVPGGVVPGFGAATIRAAMAGAATSLPRLLPTLVHQVGDAGARAWSALPLLPTQEAAGWRAVASIDSIRGAMPAAASPPPKPLLPPPPALAVVALHFCIRDASGRVSATSLHTDASGAAIGGDDSAVEVALDDSDVSTSLPADVLPASAADAPTQALWCTAIRSAVAGLPGGTVHHVIVFNTTEGGHTPPAAAAAAAAAATPTAAAPVAWEIFLGWTSWRAGFPRVHRAPSPPPVGRRSPSADKDEDGDGGGGAEGGRRLSALEHCRRALAAKEAGNADMAAGRLASAGMNYSRGLSELFHAERDADIKGDLSAADGLRIRALRAILAGNRSLSSLRDGDASTAAWDAGNALGAIPVPYPAASSLDGGASEAVRLLDCTPPAVDWRAMHAKALYRRAAARTAAATAEITKATAKPRQVARLDRATSDLQDAARDLVDARAVVAAGGPDAGIAALDAEIGVKQRMVARLQKLEEGEVVASLRRAFAAANGSGGGGTGGGGAPGGGAPGGGAPGGGAPGGGGSGADAGTRDGVDTESRRRGGDDEPPPALE